METLTSQLTYNGLHSLKCLKQEIQQLQNGKLTSKQGNKFAIIEKELKALEIIKVKQVNVHWCGGLPPLLLQTYSISREEYDLLEEVLYDKRL